MIPLRLRPGGFRTKIFTSRQLLYHFSRCNSTRPPFDHTSKFQLVDSPSPSWRIGDGLPPEMHHWKEVTSASRKTWDFTNLENGVRDSYKILTSAIIPRPIALVSTLSLDGIPNLAPFSYFSMVSHNPPMISLSFSLSERRPKDTRDNILNSKEFTVSIISEPFVEAANSTSVESPADHDEWIFSGLSKENSHDVEPPFVRESAICMECELYHAKDIGFNPSDKPTTTVILGLIRKIHVRESVLSGDGQTVDPAKLQCVSRLGGTMYARLLEGFEVPRVSWKVTREKYQPKQNERP
ncbi:hypothetical protein BYT27DRAFT_7101408 [Phlegmacium glaucopus]|nr:hypothetical protein BYT27DRAFT_7101408 [Phlegmacium glaucopus]